MARAHTEYPRGTHLRPAGNATAGGWAQSGRAHPGGTVCRQFRPTRHATSPRSMHVVVCAGVCRRLTVALLRCGSMSSMRPARLVTWRQGQTGATIGGGDDNPRHPIEKPPSRWHGSGFLLVCGSQADKSGRRRVSCAVQSQIDDSCRKPTTLGEFDAACDRSGSFSGQSPAKSADFKWIPRKSKILGRDGKTIAGLRAPHPDPLAGQKKCPAKAGLNIGRESIISVTLQGRDTSVCSALDTQQIIATIDYRGLSQQAVDLSRPIKLEEAPAC